MVDDTCGFTPPATGYRSLTGRQAPVKLQSAARPHPDPVLAPTPFTDFCDGDNGMGVIY